MHVIYHQKNFPLLQNRLYDSPSEALQCPKGDIELVEDPNTGLIYNQVFRPELMAYDENYQNEQAGSDRFRQHLTQVAEIVKQEIGHVALVEVGCGKGFFLNMLQADGCSITGFDPTYAGNNRSIRKCYFEPGVHSEAKGLILRHVLEHIKNPVEFLFQLRESNGGSGLVYIEVPCFDWICNHWAWFDIYYEHVNYFRMGDFLRMFGRIVASGYFFGGQYMYVVGDLRSLRRPRIKIEEKVKFPADFNRKLESQTAVAREARAIWGGSSKGVIFALLCARAGFPIDIVVDINPAKQGKYLPATAVRVHSPEECLAKLPRDSTICVMNANYLSEVINMTMNRYKYETLIA